MKSLFKNSFILFFITLTSIQGQTNVSGDINVNTTWSLTKSPYYLTNHVWVNNGAKLTIESGVKVYQQGNIIGISSGLLDANGVTFNNGVLRFSGQSSGTITNCDFTKIESNFNDNSNPSVTNNKYDVSSSINFHSQEALPRISGNTYLSKKISLSFTITKNLVLKNLPDVDYYLDNHLWVDNGAKLTIESGVKVYQQGNIIGISSGSLDANGITFNNGEIRFSNQSSGTIMNSSLTKIQANIYDSAKLTITKSNIDIFSKVNNSTSSIVSAKNNFWGDSTGPKHSTNPNGYGATISDKVDYIPFATKEFDITTSVERIGESLPTAFLLSQNYPNPFNPTTTINYTLPFFTKVKLELFDLTGRLVAVLSNQEQSAGVYKVKFDGSWLSSGIYYYRLQSPTFSETKKMLLIK